MVAERTRALMKKKWLATTFRKIGITAQRIYNTKPWRVLDLPPAEYCKEAEKGLQPK